MPAPLWGVTPLLFDSATQTVIAAARAPGVLVVYADGGNIIATVDCECGDADDIWLDAMTKTVLISSGAVAGTNDGSVTAFRQDAREAYTLLGRRARRARRGRMTRGRGCCIRRYRTQAWARRRSTSSARE